MKLFGEIKSTLEGERFRRDGLQVFREHGNASFRESARRGFREDTTRFQSTEFVKLRKHEALF